jgi:hypothetical protein
MSPHTNPLHHHVDRPCELRRLLAAPSPKLTRRSVSSESGLEEWHIAGGEEGRPELELRRHRAGRPAVGSAERGWSWERWVWASGTRTRGGRDKVEIVGRKNRKEIIDTYKWDLSVGALK